MRGGAAGLRPGPRAWGEPGSGKQHWSALTYARQLASHTNSDTGAGTPRPPLVIPPLMSGRSPPIRGGGGSPSDGPPQPQFQCNLKKSFLRRLVFPTLIGPNDGPPHEGGDCKGWGLQEGGGGLRYNGQRLCGTWSGFAGSNPGPS